MNFWKTFWASMLSWAVGFGILFFVIIVMFVSMIISIIPEIEESSATGNILCINLNENIVDAPAVSIMSGLDATSLTVSETLTTLQVLAAIDNAATDDTIDGICINTEGSGVISMANTEELREALERFKLSGKFIVAYDDSYTQHEYYLASVADKIVLNPEGGLEWRGVSMGLTFYKRMLDKLGVTVEIFRPTACRYKSAVEPFFLTKMSDANRRQNQEMVSSIWEGICNDVALSRNIDPKQLAKYAEERTIVFAEDALAVGMIDMVAHEDALKGVYEEYGVEVASKISLGSYIANLGTPQNRVCLGSDIPYTSQPVVAIIYAEGEIVDGNQYEDGMVYGRRLALELRNAREDDKVKAVVLRVNSPGGSALASEVAWREMVLLQQVKPVVVSMGDMAASGGYYISAPADYIFADKFTLTGSIGVFGMIPNLQKLLEERIGITYDSAYTSPAAEGLSTFSPMSSDERNYIMKGVDRVYNTFTSHVAEGRNLDIDYVLTIAEGRVWSGDMAKEIGLVDEIGGLSKAIAKAVELADIGDNYKLYEYVAPLTPFEEWLDSMGMLYANTWGLDYNIYGEQIRSIIMDLSMITSMEGIRAEVVGDLRVEF